MVNTPFLTSDPWAKCQAKMFWYLPYSNVDDIRTRLVDTYMFIFTQAGVVALRSVLDGLKKKAGEVAERIKQLEVKTKLSKDHWTQNYPPGGSLCANQLGEGWQGGCSVNGQTWWLHQECHHYRCIKTNFLTQNAFSVHMNQKGIATFSGISYSSYSQGLI